MIYNDKDYSIQLISNVFMQLIEEIVDSLIQF